MDLGPLISCYQVHGGVHFSCRARSLISDSYEKVCFPPLRFQSLIHSPLPVTMMEGPAQQTHWWYIISIRESAKGRTLAKKSQSSSRRTYCCRKICSRQHARVLLNFTSIYKSSVYRHVPWSSLPHRQESGFNARCYNCRELRVATTPRCVR